MNILVVGTGGREHALAWKFAGEPGVTKVLCASGNAGTRAVATTADVPPGNVEALADLAERERIDLTVVGPELPLDRGIADLFRGARAPRVRPHPRRRATRVQQGLRERVHGQARHPDSALPRVRKRPRGVRRRRVRRARVPRCRQGRRPGRGEGGRRRPRSRHGGRGDSRRHGRAPVRRCGDPRRPRGMPGRARGVVLRPVRRPTGDAALVGAGSQARLRRRRGAEYRRHGRVLAEPAPGCAAAGAHHARHRRPGRRRASRRGARVSAAFCTRA